jgi:hypothetical protein
MSPSPSLQIVTHMLQPSVCAAESVSTDKSEQVAPTSSTTLCSHTQLVSDRLVALDVVPAQPETCNGNCNDSVCDNHGHSGDDHANDESNTAAIHDCLSPIPSRKQASSSQEDKSTVKKRKIRK